MIKHSGTTIFTNYDVGLNVQDLMHLRTSLFLSLATTKVLEVDVFHEDRMRFVWERSAMLNRVDALIENIEIEIGDAEPAEIFDMSFTHSELFETLWRTLYIEVELDDADVDRSYFLNNFISSLMAMKLEVTA